MPEKIINSKKFLSAGLFLFFLWAWKLQNLLLLNSDVSWLLLASKRLWAGGSYLNDFFEINPPAALYLYSPAVFLSTFFNDVIAIRFYIFLLSSISLFYCWKLSKVKIILLTLAIIYLVLPANEFGQREHLFIILVMPYLFLISTRLNKDIQIANPSKILIGIMAGCGFIIKPYFLIIWLLCEFYFFIKVREINFLFRHENYAIIFIGGVYALSILLLQRDYLDHVIPLVKEMYYQNYGTTFNNLFLNPAAVFCYFVLGFHCLSKKNNVNTVIAIALMGSLFIYFFQQTLWFYHLYPAWAFSILLLTNLFYDLTKNPCSLTLKIMLLSGTLLLYLFFNLHYISIELAFYPIGYFAWISCVFGFIIFSNSPNKVRNLILFSLILLTGYLFAKNLQLALLHQHEFFITTLLVFLILMLCIPHKKRLKMTFITLIGLIFFSYPFYQTAYTYSYAQDYKKLYSSLLIELNKLHATRILFLSDIADFGFPATSYTHQQLASRFSALSWVPVLNFGSSNEIYSQNYFAHKSVYDFYVNALSQDIINNKPIYVLVDLRNTDKDNIKRYYGSRQLDYIRFFSQNSAFKAAWKNYQLIRIIDGQPLYRLAIYQLKNPEQWMTPY